MKKTMHLIFAPLLSLVILTIGNGLLVTFVSLRMKLDGYSPDIIGYINSAYFAGLMLGAIRSHKLIERIGHIRAFATFAAVNAGLVLFQILYINPWAWLGIRLLGGVCMAGIFITIESWLLAHSSKKTRGAILSVYMIVFYGAQSGGQFLLDLSDINGIVPFLIVIIFFCFSIVPAAVTKISAPDIEKTKYTNIFKLFKLIPLSVVLSIINGFILGGVYGLLPIFAQGIGLNVSQIALLMGVTIFGGLVLQWPMGKISDHMDRRKVILFINALAALLSIIIIILNGRISFPMLLVILGFFGGATFTVFPVNLSNAIDQVETSEIIATTGALNLAYACGAIAGPILAAYSMSLWGPEGLFYYNAFFYLLSAVYTLYRIIYVRSIPKEEKQPFQNIPRTSPMVGKLNPEATNNNPDNKNNS